MTSDRTASPGTGTGTGTGQSVPAGGHGAGTGRLPFAVAGLVLGILMSVLDQTVVAIALPDIAADLGEAGSIGWVVTAYVLASTATGAVYGRLSDRFGRRAVFLSAITVFTVASVLCGLAQSMPQLIAARTLQGVGAGALFTVPSIALAELFPLRLRARVQGYVGGVFALASVGGPLVGGSLTDAAGWRWIFYVNLPIGLLSIILVATSLRLPRSGDGARMDVAGAVLLAGATVSLLLATEWGGRTHSWTSPAVLGLVVAALALAAAFWWQERRAAAPLIPPRLFAGRTLRVVFPATALLGALLYGSIVFLPTYLQVAFDLSATQAGLAGNPYFITFIVVSAIAGGRAGRSGRFTPYLLSGAVIVVPGLLLLSRADLDSPYALVATGMAVLGVGFGLIMQNLMTVAQNAVRPADLGAVTSAVVTVRGFGMAVGVALFNNLLIRHVGDDQRPEAIAGAVPEVLVWGVAPAAALVALMAAMPRTEASERAGAAPETGRPS
ncbi:MDR family MFS transporter [Streptosporangium sp. NPDC003464]